MSEQLEPVFSDKTDQSSINNINIEKILSKIFAYWPIFIISIIIALAIAYIQLRYATPVYKVDASVLVKDDKASTGGDAMVLQELGFNTGVGRIDNEVEILKSRTLMKRVVRKSNLNFRYYAPGRLKITEIYFKDLQFSLEPLFPLDSIIKGHSFKIKKIQADKHKIIEGDV